MISKSGALTSQPDILSYQRQLIWAFGRGQKVGAALVDLNPIAASITKIPWKDIETVAKFGVDKFACIKGFKHSVYSINLYQIDVPILINFTKNLDDVFKQYPGLQQGIWALVQYPDQIIKSVPDQVTAYPWRSTVGYV